MHYNYENRIRGLDSNLHFLYGPKYSPEYNPIEGLWADAKRRFSKKMLTETRTDNLDVINNLIADCILKTNRDYLARRVD